MATASPAMLIRGLFALMLGYFAPDPAPPAAMPAQCSVKLYSVDQDKVSNVRLGPSSETEIEAKIDPSYAVLHVTGVSGNWFHVTRIEDAETDMKMFEGSGWVHRSLLGLSVASGENWLMNAPDAGATKVLKLVPDGNLLQPLDCKGEWLKVLVDGKSTGWIDRAAQCSNPMTTCS